MPFEATDLETSTWAETAIPADEEFFRDPIAASIHDEHSAHLFNRFVSDVVLQRLI